ncbi:MAG: O-antigen ligase family protein [Myxococcota bacterium]
MTLGLGVAVMGFGGVHPPTRALLHGLLVVATGLAVAQPDIVLGRSGRVVELGFVWAGATLVMAGGLVPLPGFVLAWVQPGTAAAAPDRWHTLSWSAASTLDAITWMGLIGGAMVLTGVWAASRSRRHPLDPIALAATVVVVGTALFHATVGLTTLYGFVDTWVRPPNRFFAPFLNDNHLASLLLLSWPLLVDGTVDAAAPPMRRLATLGLGLASVTLFVWTGSLGALVVALGVALVVGALRRLVPWAAVVGLGILAVVGLVAFDPLSEHGRTDLWRATLALWLDHPIFGSGAGTYRQAINAYRTDLDYVTWDHAHNDWLEWVAETGVVGLVGLGALAWWLWRQPKPRHPERARWMWLGVSGVALHALVEFPLHIPGIAMVAAALFAFFHVGNRSRLPTDAGRVRGALIGVGGVQLLMAGWTARTALEEPAVRQVLAHSHEAGAASRRLSAVAPWRPEIGLYQAWSFEAANQTEAALGEAQNVIDAHPENPVAQRLAAQVLARTGAAAQAWEVISRSVERDPTDWRQWMTRAVIAEVHRPAEVAEAWLDAIRRGAPSHYIRRAWARLPEGLAWVDAVANRPARLSRGMGYALAELDPEAAIVAFEQARVADGYVDPGQIRLLVELQRLPEAELQLRLALAARPHDGRLAKLRATLRERQGRFREASSAWIEVAKTEPVHQLDAIRARKRADGPTAALALVEKLSLELSTRGLHPTSRLEHARLLLEVERPEACVVQIRRSSLLTHPQFEASARQLLRRCNDAATAL